MDVETKKPMRVIVKTNVIHLDLLVECETDLEILSRAFKEIEKKAKKIIESNSNQPNQ